MRKNLALRSFAGIATLTAACLANAAPHLTDSTVFSTNSTGENWNSWIWNTQGSPADGPNRWNLYYSSSSDPANPLFLNSENDASTNIAIELAPGVHNFLIYGESVTTTLDPQQHFVLNLYFDAHQAAADISGLYGSACPIVCAASHANGLDLLGGSGAQEAGTLLYIGSGHEVTLTKFTWQVGRNVDEVWSHWDNTAPYSSGSGTPDFVGEVQLTVRGVPAPATAGLVFIGLAGLFVGRRRLPF